jgi:hypothetical protein
MVGKYQSLWWSTRVEGYGNGGVSVEYRWNIGGIRGKRVVQSLYSVEE